MFIHIVKMKIAVSALIIGAWQVPYSNYSACCIEYNPALP
jgi:hypothetical protein